MPKRSNAYMQERRRQILDAATRCAMREGWRRITIDDVAAAASLSKGAVYVHFQSKQALLQGLLERSVENIDAIGACQTADEFRQSLGAELAAICAPQGRQLAIKQLELLMESARNTTLRSAFRRGTERLIEAVQTVVRRLRPELTDAGAADVALLLILLLHGARSLRAQSDVPSGAQLQQVLEREMNALLQPAQSPAIGATLKRQTNQRRR
jgi:TetR/AcrR family transcriptional regulator, transcriptional repressor of aconitase